MGDKAQDTTHFGYRDVPREDKARLVGEVFSSVAGSYDLMNDLMSLGIHRLWKRHFVAVSGLRRGDRVLDLAGGTGDITALMAPRVGKSGRVILSDINQDMLRVGRQRMENRGLVDNIRYALINAEQLPFESGSMDAVTIAFGLRNVTDKERALGEMHRVLRPGGKLMILEFSRLQQEQLAQAYERYSFSVLPRLGQLFANDADSYRYLAESIRRHPDQETLEGMMREAGFERTHYRNLTGGIVAIHSGFHV